MLTLELERLMTAFPRHLWLDIAPQLRTEAWQQVQDYSNDVARWNAYKNYLCVHPFIAWVKEEPDLPNSLLIWSNLQSLSSTWEVVNGTAIELDRTRIVLIPSETADIDSFCVPQEWLDIPSWTGDYYLAVQINLEDENCWMRIWGFTTHQQLKTGKYDPIQRTYSLEPTDLIENLNSLWVARELCPEKKPAVEPLPSLSLGEAEKLLEKLSQPTPYSPRLEVSFADWGALLAEEKWRQQLYKRRIKNPNVEPITVVAASTPNIVNLRQWLQNAVEEGQNAVKDVWQTFEAFFDSLEPTIVHHRSDLEVRNKAIEPSSTEAIAPVIRLLQPNQQEEIRLYAAGVLGEIGRANLDAIKALTDLLHTANDEETRWQAALSLGKIDPGNPQAGIKKARLIDLGMQLDGHAVALIVAIMPKIDGRIGVFLQVKPYKEAKLPLGLKLSVLSESGEAIPQLEVVARSDNGEQGDRNSKDKLIVLRFSPLPAKYFRVQVTLGDASFAESFIA